VVANLRENAVDEALALVAEGVVDITALDKEHVHPEFKRHLLSDSDNSVLVFFDLGLELLSAERFLVQELLNALFFLKKEQELVVNASCQLNHFNIL
jgi:hypothetical protein